MKVLVVTSTFPRFADDDQVPWLLELCLVLRENGVDLEVLAPTYAGLKSHEVHGIPVHRFRYFTKDKEVVTHEAGAMNTLVGRRDLTLPAFALVGAGMAAAARLARAKHYDAIHSQWPLPMGLPAQAGAWASVGTSRKRPRLVASFHGAEVALARRKSHYRPVLRGISRGLDAAIANSSHTAASVRELAGIEPLVIPWGPPRGAVNLGRKPEGPRRESPDGLPVVLMVGRLIERKGVPVLVRAAKRLRGAARVVVVGDGEYRPVIEAEIKRRGVADVVELAGRVSNEDLSDLYARCAVFCLPAVVDSRGETEGLGVVLIEAMSHGKPVVASRLGGIVDAVEDGKTGILVPPDDPDILTDALLRVIRDRDLAARLGEAGRERAKKTFSWAEISRRHVEVYAGTRDG